jgi:glycosyltransferase involved in cell wall biosynthesis
MGPMHLLIDLQSAQNGSRWRGIGRYSRSLAKALSRNCGPHRITVLLNARFPESIADIRRDLGPDVEQSSIAVMRIPERVSADCAANAWRRRAAELLRQRLIAAIDPDAVLIASLFEGFADDTVSSVESLVTPVPTAVVLYDLIPMTDPDLYLGSKAAKAWYSDRLDNLRRSSLVLPISHSAAQEARSLVGVAGSKVTIISSAADERFVGLTATAGAQQSLRSKLGISRPYLMHCGNVEPRKNFEGLIRAYARVRPALRRAHQLVLVGHAPEEGRTRLQSHAAAEGLQPDEVVLTGYLPDPELAALYLGSALFVYPSRHEGFGLPALEAMHFGVPTIGARCSSIPEVIGRDDALFDPDSPSEVAALIERTLDDDVFRRDLVEHGARQAQQFNWNVTAASAWRAIEERVERSDRSKIRGRLDDRGTRSALLRQLCVPCGGIAPTDKDLQDVADCVVHNERSAVLRSAFADVAGAFRVRAKGLRIVGSFRNEPVRALADALRSLGHSVDAPIEARDQEHRTIHDVCTDPLYTALDDAHGGGVELQIETYAGKTDVDAFRDQAGPRAMRFGPVICTTPRQAIHHYLNGSQAWAIGAGLGLDHLVTPNQADLIVSPVPSSDKRPFVFLHLVRNLWKDGTDLALDAFGTVLGGDHSVELLIAASVDAMPGIEDIICRNYSLSGERRTSIRIVPMPADRSALRDLVGQCDVLLYPARLIGFYSPIAFAVAQGVPVVTTRSGDHLEYCTARSAWLVDFEFVEVNVSGRSESLASEAVFSELCEALRQASYTPRAQLREMGQAGLKHLLNEFSWRDVASRLVASVLKARLNEPDVPARIECIASSAAIRSLPTLCLAPQGLAGESVSIVAWGERASGMLDSSTIGGDSGTGFFTDQEIPAHRQLSNASPTLPCTLIVGTREVLCDEMLSQFLNRLVDRGTPWFMVMDVEGIGALIRLMSLGEGTETLDALRRCACIFAPSVRAMNLLRELGLLGNLALAPRCTRVPSGRDPIEEGSVFSSGDDLRGLIDLCIQITRTRAPERQRDDMRLARAGCEDRAIGANVCEPEFRVSPSGTVRLTDTVPTCGAVASDADSNSQSHATKRPLCAHVVGASRSPFVDSILDSSSMQSASIPRPQRDQP